MVNIAEIKKRADALGLTLAALERRANLGNGVIGGWNTASPRLDTIQKVAAVLECSVDDLIIKEAV